MLDHAITVGIMVVEEVSGLYVTGISSTDSYLLGDKFPYPGAHIIVQGAASARDVVFYPPYGSKDRTCRATVLEVSGKETYKSFVKARLRVKLDTHLGDVKFLGIKLLFDENTNDDVYNQMIPNYVLPESVDQLL
jgi:hypothetical protein